MRSSRLAPRRSSGWPFPSDMFSASLDEVGHRRPRQGRPKWVQKGAPSIGSDVAGGGGSTSALVAGAVPPGRPMP